MERAIEVDAALARRLLAAQFPEEQLVRARVLALHLCSALAYSGGGGDVAEAIAGLERTVR